MSKRLSRASPAPSLVRPLAVIATGLGARGAVTSFHQLAGHEIGVSAQMISHGPGRTGRSFCPQGLNYGPVFRLRLRPVVPRPHGEQVAIGMSGISQPFDQSRQARTASCLVYGGMKTSVEAEVFDRIADTSHLRQETIQCGDLFLGDPFSRFRGCQRFQGNANLVILTQVIQARTEDHNAPVRIANHQAFAEESCEGLADRGCTHTKTSGELDLSEWSACWNRSRHDLSAQRIGDCFRSGSRKAELLI